jgi:hypothetical protein
VEEAMANASVTPMEETKNRSSRLAQQPNSAYPVSEKTLRKLTFAAGTPR